MIIPPRDTNKWKETDMPNVLRSLWERVPENTKIKLRGDYNSVRHRFVDRPRDGIVLCAQSLLGKRFLSWYAKRLDATASQVKPGEGGRHLSKIETMKTGAEDLEVVKRFGLQADNSLYEFGTGFGRSAQHFVNFLDTDHYFGNDISAARIRQMREFFEFNGLAKKNPTFFVTANNSFDWAEGKTFDFIWTMAVFCHMPDEDVREVFRNVQKIMHPSSIFLALDTHLDDSDRIHRYNAKDWFRPPSWYCDAAAEAGLHSEDVSEKLVAGVGSQNVSTPLGYKGMKFSSHLIKMTLS